MRLWHLFDMRSEVVDINLILHLAQKSIEDKFQPLVVALVQSLVYDLRDYKFNQWCIWVFQ